MLGATGLALDVALTPAFVAPDAQARRRTTFIVVDVIRATTTLCVLFAGGCRRVLVAPGIAAARAARDTRGRDALLAGEVGGLAPAGFDFGNSPEELAHALVKGREMVFATTNGTRALQACAGGRAIFAGALRNARAVCAAALDSVDRERGSDVPKGHGEDAHEQRTATPGGASEAALMEREPDVVIVCSGRGDRPAFDDTICAGHLISELRRRAEARGTAIHLREGARIALATWNAVERHGELRAALAESDAARAIAHVGLSSDLDWCAAIDATDVVPAVCGTTPDGLLLVEQLPTT